MTSVGTACQQAIYDDALYLVKLRVEELRILAAPADLRDDLMAMSLEAAAGEVEVADARRGARMGPARRRCMSARPRAAAQSSQAARRVAARITEHLRREPE